MKTFLNRYILSTCAFGLLVGSVGQIATADETVLEEILVTAQKREESIQDIAISIKALSGRILRQINAESMDDIVGMVPSLSMNNLGRGNNNIQIRGLGSNIGSVNTMAMYNDGVVAASRIQSSGTFAEQDSALVDIERIEVLRGPQGTLWGEGSFGGLISIISKRPDPSGFTADLSANWFNVKGGGNGSTDLSAVLNIPLITDKLALRVVGYRNDHKGWIDGWNIFPSGPGPEFVGKDLNTEEVSGGRFSLGYTGEKVDANWIVKVEESDTGLLNIEGDFLNILRDTIGNENNQAFFGPTLAAALAPGVKRNITESILNINIDTTLGTVTSITGYGNVETESPSGATSESEAWSQELRLSSDSDGRLNYTIGAYYRDAKRNVDLLAGPLSLNETQQWAVFGQFYFDITPSLQATFGLRYSEQDSLIVDINQIPVLGDFARAEGTFNDLSPKVALDWQINDQSMVYASIAKGFRAGGANVDQSFGTDPNFSQKFDEDYVWNYEIGSKTSFADNRVTVNAAVFYVDWHNIQIDRPITDLTDPNNPAAIYFIVGNGEDAHSFGAEADITLNPAEGWEIVLGGSLVEAEYDNGSIFSVAGPFPLKGQRLPSSPRFLFNASVEKQFPIMDSGWDGFVRADYSLRDGSYADVPNERPDSEFLGDKMSVLNLRLGANNDMWEFQAYVRNLLNEDASSFNFVLTDSLRFVAKVPPRTLGVSVKWHYR